MQLAQQRCAFRVFFARIPAAGGGHERHHQRAYFYIGTFSEERRLVRQFGEAYRAYQRNTPYA
jgi:protein-S-isoprenylcysteine O-methyltransferase Ste14